MLKELLRKLVRLRSRLRRTLLNFLEWLAIRVVIPAGVRKWSQASAAGVRATQKPVLFMGYGSPTGRLAHRIVGEHLNSFGYAVSHSTPPAVLSKYSRAWKKDVTGPGRRLSTPGELSDYLVDNSNGEYFFKRGVVDEYLRRAPRAFFVGDNWVPDSFLAMANSVLEEANELMEDRSSLVVVDTAYLQKGALISAAKSQGKPVWVLDPAGRWREVPDAGLEYLERAVYQEARNLQDFTPEVVSEADSYFSSRLAGSSESDIDARFVYGEDAASGTVQPRKILFLHAIRDAAGLPLRSAKEGHLFATFLEWATQALTFVAESPNDWWIKPHPQKFLFPDEEKILQDLVALAGIPADIVRPEIDTRWVLKNRLPVYTHSGTITVEAAAHGYKAHVCTDIYSSRLSNISFVLGDMAKQYRLPLAEASEKILSAEDVDTAKVVLFQKFLLFAKELSPGNVAYEGRTINEGEISERKRTLELLKRYGKEPAHARAAIIAHDIATRAEVRAH